MRAEDRLRARVRMYFGAFLPPPPAAVWSAIEHGRMHVGTKEERAREWGRLAAQGVRVGLPDGELTWMRRFIKLECKVGKNKLSESQEDYRSAWEANGGIYIEVRSVVALDAALRALNLPIPRSMQIAAMDHDAKLAVPEPPKKRAGRRWDLMPTGEQVAAESAARLQQFLDEGE